MHLSYVLIFLARNPEHCYILFLPLPRMDVVLALKKQQGRSGFIRSFRPPVLSRILFDPAPRSLLSSLFLSVSLLFRALSEKSWAIVSLVVRKVSELMYASRYLIPAKVALKKVKGQQSNVECVLMYERLCTHARQKSSLGNFEMARHRIGEFDPL